MYHERDSVLVILDRKKGYFTSNKFEFYYFYIISKYFFKIYIYKKEKKKREALKHDVNRRQIDVWLILIYAFWRHQSKGMIST
jgi:hypothetical protein